MSRADDIGALLTQQFPGVRVTDTNRTQARQDQYVREGKTRSHNSQHLTGNGIDIVVPANVSNAAIKSFLADQGIHPGEFISETGRGSNQGTGAHLHIGLAPKAAQPVKAKGGDLASSGGGSSFDRANASRQRDEGPSIAKAYQAYANTGKAGGMTPQEAAQFERGVLDGHVMLPRGAQLRVKPPVAVLPKSVVEAYNSHRMDDDPDARAQIEQSLAAGEVALPRGMRLQAPKARTAGERIGMGVRNIAEGTGGLVDMVAGPLNTIVNGVTGSNLSRTPTRDLAGRASDALGLAKPESDTENLYSAINEGGAQGLATAGLGMIAAPVEGATGVIGKAVSSSPLLDTVSGAAAGGAQESARQAGAGPVEQFVAGLAGGLTPVGLAGVAERGAARMRAPKDIAAVVAETPRAAVIDEAGNLTPHGQEVATRHGVTPEEVHAAYEAPPTVQRGVANDSALPEDVAKEATNNLPNGQQQADNQPPVVATPARAVPEVAPEAAPQARVPEPVTPAAENVTRAKDFGVDLSRGQATKSFDIQDAEQRLRNSNGPEGEQMRQFVAKQTEQVSAAVEQFKQAVGDTNLTPEQRGIEVQDAIRELRDNGQKGVSALYKQARELGQEAPIDTAGIRNAYDRLMVEADVPEAVKAVLTQEAARYGIIGKAEVIDKASGKVTAENGITKYKLDNGDIRAVYGPPQRLGLDNAEDFRKVVSKQYQADGGQKLTGILKRAIDDAVEEAATSLAAQGENTIPGALKAARAAHVEQVKTFRSKDIVQSIVDWKKGAEGVTSVLKPEEVMARALGKVSDLKQLKAVLLSKPVPKSKAAWAGIKAHAMAELFKKATTRNTNAAGEITEAISGAKLRTAVESFGVDKLKVLLDADEFGWLMKLRRVIEDVTIPITGTVNPTNSGNLIMRLVKDADNQFTAAASAAGFAVGGPAGAAIAGGAARMAAPAIKAAKEGAQAAETLKGATEYTPELAATDTGAKPVSAVRKATTATKEAGAKTVRAFIDIYGSPRILAPILASSGGENQ